MERRCKNCKHFSFGMTVEQRNKWAGSNWGRYADGVCSLHFPRGYVARKPPHPAHSNGKCFQFEGKGEKWKQICIDTSTEVDEENSVPAEGGRE